MLFYQEKTPELKITLSLGEAAAIAYHDIFDYPLTYPEILKWTGGNSLPTVPQNFEIESDKGYFYKKGKAQNVYKRLIRKRISARKIVIAKKAAQVLSFVPSVLFVGITGSLAMHNASDGSDIDLMIVTKRGKLWTTRFVGYALLSLFRLALRRPGNKDEKDKLCLNIWLDENNLTWTKKNIYTAHEIAQVVPVFDRGDYFTTFMVKNRWLKAFWPNAVKLARGKKEVKRARSGGSAVLFAPIERLFYGLQKSYMKGKVTRETVAPGKAIFHPIDLSELVYFSTN